MILGHAGSDSYCVCSSTPLDVAYQCIKLAAELTTIMCNNTHLSESIYRTHLDCAWHPIKFYNHVYLDEIIIEHVQNLILFILLSVLV